MDELEESRDDSDRNSYTLQEDPDCITILEEISEDVHPELKPEDLLTDMIMISASKDPWSCLLCKELFTNPVECTTCHDLFCESCVIQTSKCPRCQSSASWVQNLPIRRILQEMMVRCKHSLCSKLLRKDDLASHELTCDLALIACKNSSSCGLICRKDLDLHYTQQCDYRPVDCPSSCGKSIAFCDVEAHLQYDCLNAEVQCPQGCQKSMQRRKIDYHILHTCPLSVISCMFFSYDDGYCGYKCVRAELEEHQLICNLRKVRCNNIGCSQRIVYKSANEHDDICKFKKIDCPNGCEQEFLRGVSAEHLKTCELQVINCSYSVVGCQESFFRKMLDSHLVEKSYEHSIMMVKWIQESSFKIEKLAFDFQRAKQEVAGEIRGIREVMGARRQQQGLDIRDLFLC